MWQLADIVLTDVSVAPANAGSLANFFLFFYPED
jgi:hypothetical protein